MTKRLARARCAARAPRALAAPALITCVALLLAGCGSAGRPTTSTAAESSPGSASTVASAADGLRGLVPEPLPHVPSFVLSDTSGHAFSFAPATRGKLTYLYFGYTHCPDACPATMSDISAALRLVSPAVRHRIEVVFVTVDPRRDSGPVLRTWLDHYGRSFVGLRGTLGQIAAAEEAAGVPPAPREPQASGDYSVPHSSLLFAYSPDGLAHVVYSQGFTPGDYAHDMPLLLRFTH